MTDAAGCATRLASFAARLRLADVPDDALAVARRCVVDTAGVALAGGTTPSARRIAALAAAQYVAGPCRLLPSGVTLGPAGAALANGAAAHALDFDDNCYAGVVHGSATTLPAVLAAAQAVAADGATLLAGFVAGVEVQYALGLALTRRLYERGWWTTAVLGAIGAAAGAARVLGLDAAATEAAIGLAAAGAGGVRAVRGSDGKHYLCGRAAESGVSAALLARDGAVGPADVFADRNGVAAAFNDGLFEPAPVARLGLDWRLLDPGIDVKRQPTCYASHAACDALAALMAEHALDAADIEAIECAVPPLVASNLTYPRPRNATEAQFSLEFALAATAVAGGVTLDHLCQGVAHDPALEALLGRVRMRVDPALAEGDLAARCPEGAGVVVRTRGGARLERYECVARGAAARPLTDDEVDAKFTDCARRAVDQVVAGAWLSQLRQVDAVADARRLFDPAPDGAAGSAGRPG